LRKAKAREGAYVVMGRIIAPGRDGEIKDERWKMKKGENAYGRKNWNVGCSGAIYLCP